MLRVEDRRGDDVMDRRSSLAGVEGRAMDGRVGVEGTMDFAHQPPRFDLDLALDGVNVADAPPAWKLGELGLSGGKMSGRADLNVVLTPGLVDLSGSSGQATIRDGVLQGIPVKSLKLVMSAEGDELRYDTADAGSAWRAWAWM